MVPQNGGLRYYVVTKLLPLHWLHSTRAHRSFSGRGEVQTKEERCSHRNPTVDRDAAAKPIDNGHRTAALYHRNNNNNNSLGRIDFLHQIERYEREVPRPQRHALKHRRNRGEATRTKPLCDTSKGAKKSHNHRAYPMQKPISTVYKMVAHSRSQNATTQLLFESPLTRLNKRPSTHWRQRRGADEGIRPESHWNPMVDRGAAKQAINKKANFKFPPWRHFVVPFAGSWWHFKHSFNVDYCYPYYYSQDRAIG